MGSTRLPEALDEEVAELIARRFAALAEPMRLRILDALRVLGEVSVGELAEVLDAKHANVSKHLNVLYAAKIVGRRKEDTRACYRITDPVVFRLCQEICGRLHEELASLGALENPPPLLSAKEPPP